MAPKGPHQPAQPYYTQGAGQYGQPGQPNPYMPGASYGQPATDPYAQHSMPDPYAMPSGQDIHPGHQMPYGMPPQQGPQQGFLVPNDPLVAVGTTMLRQSGANYLESGKRYMQSWTGVLSGAMLQHHFDISSSYVRNKLMMLLVPFLRRWNFTRVLEQPNKLPWVLLQITGGHKFLPPRQDVNAPDLYIPFMAVCTFCLLASVSKMLQGIFTPESMYAVVSEGFGAWAVHWVVLKALMYALGTSNAIPFLELLAYAGYAFVPICLSLLARLTLGAWGYRIVWAYGTAAIGVVLVRTIKRVIFYEARQYSIDSTRHNYLLLAVWVFEFPFTWWLTAGF